MYYLEIEKIESNRFSLPNRIDNYRFGYRIPITGEYWNLHNWPSQCSFLFRSHFRRLRVCLVFTAKSGLQCSVCL